MLFVSLCMSWRCFLACGCQHNLLLTSSALLSGSGHTACLVAKPQSIDRLMHHDAARRSARALCCCAGRHLCCWRRTVSCTTLPAYLLPASVPAPCCRAHAACSCTNLFLLPDLRVTLLMSASLPCLHLSAACSCRICYCNTPAAPNCSSTCTGKLHAWPGARAAPLTECLRHSLHVMPSCRWEIVTHMVSPTWKQCFAHNVMPLLLFKLGPVSDSKLGTTLTHLMPVCCLCPCTIQSSLQLPPLTHALPLKMPSPPSTPHPPPHPFLLCTVQDLLLFTCVHCR